MTSEALESVVQELNEQILSMQPAELPIFDRPRQFSGLIATKSCQPNGFLTHLPVRHVISEAGETTKRFPQRLPVVAQIDEWSKAHQSDLPLVIAIGINYGELSERNIVALSRDYAKTEIRPRLEQAFTLGISEGFMADQHNPIPAQDKYHLVLAYLFPWITAKPWPELRLNPLEESLLLQGFGYRDPLLALNKLLDLIEHLNNRPSNAWVVFHGSSPAISQNATRFAIQRKPDGPDVLICDDLNAAPPINNSVILERPYLGRADTVSMNVDE